MRAASLVILLLFQSVSGAGFAVTGWYADSSQASLENAANVYSTHEHGTAQDLEESLRSTVQLAAQYAEIIGGAVSFMSTEYRGVRTSPPARMGELHFYITAPRTKACFDPARLRLDISFDINGVDMGGLISVSGIPIGNGRRGIVRIEGMDGMLLVDDFEPEPFIAPPLWDAPASDEAVTKFAQEVICLLFVAAALLSTLLNRQQVDQQRLQLRVRSMTKSGSPSAARAS